MSNGKELDPALWHEIAAGNGLLNRRTLFQGGLFAAGLALAPELSHAAETTGRRLFPHFHPSPEGASGPVYLANLLGESGDAKWVSPKGADAVAMIRSVPLKKCMDRRINGVHSWSVEADGRVKNVYA